MEVSRFFLAFEFFQTPHIGDAFAIIMKGIFDRCNIRYKLYAVTTYNASEIISGISMLRDQLLTLPCEDSLHFINVRFLAHLVNLAVKECLKEVHNEVTLIFCSILSIRSSKKLRELFDRLRVQIGESEASLLCLDCETLGLQLLK